MYYKLVTLVFVAVLGFTGCFEQNEEKIEKPKVKIVKIFDVSNSGKILQSSTYPAQVEAFQDVTMAFEVSGKIVKFYYKEGQKVKKGSTIAKLDDAIYKANYNQARANYNQARKDYQRYEKLFNSNSIAKIQFEKQRLNLDVTKAMFQIAKKNFQETKLVAEFDGIMAKKIVQDFARVTAKQPIIRLQDNSSYKIKFFVPENDILQVKGELTPEHISSLVDFHVTLGNNDNKDYKAKLIDISTTAEKVTRTFETTLEMKLQKDVNILPGMTAQVQVIAKELEKKRVFIPYQAVFSDSTNKSYIWVVNKNNRVQKQEVKIGKLSNEFVELLSSLDGISKIVTSGIRFLETNDEVKEYRKIGN